MSPKVLIVSPVLEELALNVTPAPNRDTVTEGHFRHRIEGNPGMHALNSKSKEQRTDSRQLSYLLQFPCLQKENSMGRFSQHGDKHYHLVMSSEKVAVVVKDGELQSLVQKWASS